MNPEIKAAPEIDGGWERIDRAGCGGAHCGDHRADPTRGEPALERLDIHASVPVTRDRLERQAEHPGDALMGVVRLCRGEDCLAGMQLTGDPQRLEVRHGATAREVAEVRVTPADHAGER